MLRIMFCWFAIPMRRKIAESCLRCQLIRGGFAC
jgi:hypothetical protein